MAKIVYPPMPNVPPIVSGNNALMNANRQFRLFAWGEYERAISEQFDCITNQRRALMSALMGRVAHGVAIVCKMSGKRLELRLVDGAYLREHLDGGWYLLDDKFNHDRKDVIERVLSCEERKSAAVKYSTHAELAELWKQMVEFNVRGR